jgi:DNA-binding MarR family transcriptional regulator
METPLPIPTSTLDSTEVANQIRVVVGRLVRRLRVVRAPDELTLSEESVLSRLDRYGPLSGAELAEQEKVKPQAISAILAKLDGRALIVREADATDGRRTLISPTPEGRRLLVSKRSQASEQMARAIDRTLTAAERKQLCDAIVLLDRVTENM